MTAKTAASMQDRFLKLLVAQMKGRDSLNPMGNVQAAPQMAQLGTTTRIDKLNVTLQALSDSMASGQSLWAANMIGHGVLVRGNGVELSNGRGEGGIELERPADSVDIAIHDQGGAPVRTIPLGAQPAGLVNWQWDGCDNAGASVADDSYAFTVTARRAGKAVDATALQFGVVSSVTQGKQGVILRVGQMDGIALAQVRKIL